MSKIIVERPRRGGGRGKPGRALALDDLPSKQGMKRPYGRATKWLNENLAPLKRFIASRVGQHWDKVFAEICQNLRADNTVQKHVRDHLGDIVALKPTLRDGRILVQWRWGKLEELSETRVRFYVHPKTGVLMRNTKFNSGASRFSETRKRSAQERSLRMRNIAPGEQLHRLKGLWYHVTLALMPEPEKITKIVQGGRVKTVLRQPRFRDVIRDPGLSNLSPLDLYGWRNVYATAKRQLSKRELVQYGLEND